MLCSQVNDICTPIVLHMSYRCQLTSLSQVSNLVLYAINRHEPFVHRALATMLIREITCEDPILVAHVTCRKRLRCPKLV